MKGKPNTLAMARHAQRIRAELDAFVPSWTEGTEDVTKLLAEKDAIIAAKDKEIEELTKQLGNVKEELQEKDGEIELARRIHAERVWNLPEEALQEGDGATMLRDLLPRLLPGPSDVDLVAIHAKRPGITPKDIKLSRRIRASRAERA